MFLGQWKIRVQMFDAVLMRTDYIVVVLILSIDENILQSLVQWFIPMHGLKAGTSYTLNRTI